MTSRICLEMRNASPCPLACLCARGVWRTTQCIPTTIVSSQKNINQVMRPLTFWNQINRLYVYASTTPGHEIVLVDWFSFHVFVKLKCGFLLHWLVWVWSEYHCRLGSKLKTTRNPTSCGAESATRPQVFFKKKPCIWLEIKKIGDKKW